MDKRGLINLMADEKLSNWHCFREFEKHFFPEGWFAPEMREIWQGELTTKTVREEIGKNLNIKEPHIFSIMVSKKDYDFDGTLIKQKYSFCFLSKNGELLSIPYSHEGHMPSSIFEEKDEINISNIFSFDLGQNR